MSPTPRSPKGWGHRQHGDCLAGLLRVGRDRRAGRPRPVGPARRIDHRANVTATLRVPPKKFSVAPGPRTCSRGGWVSTTTPWPMSGESMGWPRGGRASSSSPPIPSWWPRSSTWSVSTWPHPRTRWCYPWTKTNTSRPLSARHQVRRCSPAGDAHPRLQPARDLHPVCGPGDRHQPRHRGVQAWAPAPGVPGLPQTGCPSLPPGNLHLVMDNYAAHKAPEVRAWLAENPRFQMRFTPNSASWSNLVDVPTSHLPSIRPSST